MGSETQPAIHTTAAGLILQPRRLTQVLWATLAALVAGTVTTAARGGWDIVFALVVTMALVLLAFWLVRNGEIERAGALMLATLTISVSALIYLGQGIHAEAVCAFPGILVFASMFGTRRLFFVELMLICAVLTAIAVADWQGWHVNVVRPVSVGGLVNLLGILSVSAFFVWLMAGDLRHALARLETENERIRESHARIDVLAHHDSLTGLPNRLLARDRLEQALALARRKQEAVALLFLDLDNFKAINDSLGHAAGDLLLCEVARRLTAAVRATDTVSRQGGDEFLIVMGELPNEQAVATTAIKIVNLLSGPFHVNGMEISATGSLGIAVFPDNGSDFDTLLKNADLAMYRAKDSGRNAFRFYDAEMNCSVVETLRLISGIRAALARGEFRLHYQPMYELSSGRIVGAEALIRWRHPELGPIPPAKFIPVAERHGLINEVGTWVINEACRQAKQWQDAGLSNMVVAVNLSPVQFRRDDIEHEIVNALAASNLSPGSIELELTESLLLVDSSRLSALLGRLRARGVRFSIDDFGIGYSNLRYLQRFDVDRLKIDRSFVHRLTEDAHDEGIVRAIIEMARSLGLETVAEGIEDRPTLNRLIDLGCHCGQGFYWSPALPPDEFFAFAGRQRLA